MSKIKDIFDLLEEQKIVFDEFLWDDDDKQGFNNVIHMYKKHDVDPYEVEDIVDNDKNKIILKTDNDKYNVYGKTYESRYLLIAYTIKIINNIKMFYCITAIDLTKSQIDYYKRKGK